MSSFKLFYILLNTYSSQTTTVTTFTYIYDFEMLFFVVEYLQKLLQVHPSRLLREEASAEANRRRGNGGDNLRRHSHTPRRKKHRKLRKYSVSDEHFAHSFQLT